MKKQIKIPLFVFIGFIVCLFYAAVGVFLLTNSMKDTSKSECELTSCPIALPDVEVSDTTVADSSNADDYIILQLVVWVICQTWAARQNEIPSLPKPLIMLLVHPDKSGAFAQFF